MEREVIRNPRESSSLTDWGRLRMCRGCRLVSFTCKAEKVRLESLALNPLAYFFDHPYGKPAFRGQLAFREGQKFSLVLLEGVSSQIISELGLAPGKR